MGLFDRIKGEFIDVIEWTDDSRDTMVWRFDRYGNEIKNGAMLTVRESQVAVFINEGELADVFPPGMYELSTENMPIMSTLKGWKHGFKSPFKSEVYFVNTRKFTDQKWGTKNAIMLSDDRFGMIDIRAFGAYEFKVVDAGKFLKEIVGTDGHFSQDDINNYLRGLIVSRFTDAVGEANLPIEKYAGNVSEISSDVQGIMQDDFFTYGIELTRLIIENISMPEEIKKEIYEYSRLNKIDMQKLTQMKAAKAMEEAAKNPSGTAGAGMGMGMGFAMANQMSNMYTAPQSGNGNQNPSSNGPSGPPPLPQSDQFFVAVNGQQSGPFDLTALKQMASSGQLNQDSLVWKEGMSAWAKAGETESVSSVFSQGPPPIPGS